MSSAAGTVDRTRYDWSWFRARQEQAALHAAVPEKEDETPDTTDLDQGLATARGHSAAKGAEDKTETGENEGASMFPAAREDELVILSLLTEMQEEMDASFRLPFTSRIWLARENLEELIEDMRETLPKTILEAEQIKLHEAEIIEDAKERATQYIARAQREADMLIEEERIVLKAKERAQEILENTQAECSRLRSDAQTEADSIRAEAEQEADEVYDRLGQNLERILGQLKRQ